MTYPESAPEQVVYKCVDAHELRLHMCRPGPEFAGRGAIVFFFGGGWQMGSVMQFAPHARYFAARGLVGILADYRVSLRHGSTPFDSVDDARDAVRWVSAHATDLNIDPARIVLAGGSAGGHLAACAALSSPSESPAALVLFNPVLDLISCRAKPASLLSEDYLQISPFHLIAEGSPPAIIFHGSADTIVDLDDSRRFCEAYRKAGNRCLLHTYPGRSHGFFNLGRSREDFVDTVTRADRFLVDLHLLAGRPDRVLLNNMPVQLRTM
jgi:acetyl esterase/lipase